IEFNPTNVVSLLHFFTPLMKMSSTSFILKITNTMEKLLEEKHSTRKKNTQRDTQKVSSLTMKKNSSSSSSSLL
ncbi:hypothetical protein ACMBCN_01750, partial [Candidatus Liberibacter asiaticus]|nr:hypothetical protein [Candidatus Liberibacter asiaticus]